MRSPVLYQAAQAVVTYTKTMSFRSDEVLSVSIQDGASYSTCNLSCFSNLILSQYQTLLPYDVVCLPLEAQASKLMIT